MIKLSFSGVGSETANSSKKNKVMKFTEKQLVNYIVDKILNEMDNMFESRGLHYIKGQRGSLQTAVKKIIHKPKGEVIVVPIVPGGGKSTMIRAILKVLASAFYLNIELLNVISGVIVVVEKTAEARELCELCEGSYPGAATVIESPNDYNLALGECPIHEAGSYDMCSRKECPEADRCPLMLASKDSGKTPIIIMTHARYSFFMEDMSQFATWHDNDGVLHYRNLLLLDEMPNLLEENKLNVESINSMETQIHKLKSSYEGYVFNDKIQLFYQWTQFLRGGLLNVAQIFRKGGVKNCVIQREEIEQTKLESKNVLKAKERILKYLRSDKCVAYRILDKLSETEYLVLSVGRNFSISMPQAKVFDNRNDMKTVIFSGTAMLSPQLINNPDIQILEDNIEEDFNHLNITIYKSDYLRLTKAALNSNVNKAVSVIWVKHLIEMYKANHNKILLVTHKSFSADFCNRLKEYKGILLPYIHGNNEEHDILPYFGGVSGSNKYQEATCIICLGINLLEYGDYINRAIAFDYSGQLLDGILNFEGDINDNEAVKEVRDMLIANSLVQLIYRSALRRHSEKHQVQVVLPAVSDGVVMYLEESFPNCNVETVWDVPEECKTARLMAKTYKGKTIKAGKMLEWMQQWNGEKISTKELKEQLGLNQNQFHDVMKNKKIKSYMVLNNIEIKGKGKGAYMIGEKCNQLDCAS